LTGSVTTNAVTLVNERDATAALDPAVVRACLLFTALDDAGAADALATLHPVRQGEPATTLWVISTGKVKITRTGTHDRETVLAVLGPGDVFGETCVLEPCQRTCTATAMTDGVLGALDVPDLDDLLTVNRHLAGQLLRLIAGRLRRANEVRTELVCADVAARVASALLHLAERFGLHTDTGTRVPHELTQDELAQLVGASREAVNKALSNFTTRGWLRADRHGVVLVDVARLHQRAGRTGCPPREPTGGDSTVP
jgi:CRP/FNR family transcriptional regulator